MAWIRLAAVDELEFDSLPCEHEGAKIALFKVDGEVFATDNVCTHDYALLTDGFLEDGCVECPLHAAQFDVRTGAVNCGPAREPLKTYPIQIRDGEVWADL